MVAGGQGKEFSLELSAWGQASLPSAPLLPRLGLTRRLAHRGGNCEKLQAATPPA